MQDDEALLDTEALGRRIGKTPGAIYTMRCRGGGPPAIRIGRTLRWRRSVVEMWLESNAEPSAHAEGDGSTEVTDHAA